VLYLGSSATKTAPAGYTLAIKESKVAMYYTGETFVPGTDTGGDNGGEVIPEIDPDVFDATTYKFYALGYINGKDNVNEGATFDPKYLFVNGKLTMECTQYCYIAVRDEQNNYYQAKANNVIRDSQVTFAWCNGWAGGQRWELKTGTHYIIMRKAKFKGDVVLESVDKATYDAYSIIKMPTAIEQTEVKEQVRKIMVNGQLRIVRGDKAYDIIGREIQ
jgi:hypothetical protein